MTDRSLKYELNIIELCLESEDYELVITKLENLKNIPEIYHNPEYYLIDYYWGQVRFRVEMEREKPRRKKIDIALRHLEKSLQYNSKFSDTHMLFGMLLIVKAGFIDNKLEFLETSKGHFQKVIEEGGSLQKMYCKEMIAFVDYEIKKLPSHSGV